MGSLVFKLPEGDLTLPQLLQVNRRLEESREAGGEPFWHFNDCGCCVTVHGHDWNTAATSTSSRFVTSARRYSITSSTTTTIPSTTRTESAE